LTKNRGVDTTGINYHPDGSVFERTMIKEDPYLLGAACLFISRPFLKQCFKLFHWFFIPNFGSFAEDTELSLRAKLMNKKVLLFPKALAYHDRTTTIKSQQTTLYLGIRNQFWTIITTWTTKMIFKNILAIIHGQLVNNIFYSLKFKKLFMVQIYLDTLASLPTLLTIRKKIQPTLIFNDPNNIFSGKWTGLGHQIKRSRAFSQTVKIFSKFKFI